MQALTRDTTRQPSPLPASVTVRHRLSEATNLCYAGQRPRNEPRWRGMSHGEHVDVAHALVQNLGAELDGYALTGGEPTLNRPALLELVSYLASAAVRSFWLETNATLLSGPLLEELREAGLRELRVQLPSRDPVTYARATGLSRRDAAEHLARVEASVSTALDLGMQVVIEIPVLRGLNDDADNLLGFAGWFDRGLSLRLLELQHTSHARAPRELLHALGARPLRGGERYELCHDSRCITLGLARERTGSTLHVAADGRVRTETHDPGKPVQPPSSAPASSPSSSRPPPSRELEPLPPTLRVVSPPPLSWAAPLAAGF